MKIEKFSRAAGMKALFSNFKYEKIQMEHGILVIWALLMSHWQIYNAQLHSAWIIEPLKHRSVDAFKHPHNFIWNILPKED